MLMLKEVFRAIRIFLKLERPGCQIVSKEVAEFLDVQVKQPNPGFMGQGPQEKDVGHSACRRAAQLGFYTDPNASVGQVTQNPSWPPKVRQIPEGGYTPSLLGVNNHELIQIMRHKTPEQLQDYLEAKLKPQLVVDNVGATTDARTYGEEPDLLDPAHIRKLSMGWVMWCSGVHNLTPKQAWEVGAKSMIDSEFDGKMRGNVEILPWEPTDPCKVKIKYHDKVLNPDDPWFAEEE